LFWSITRGARENTTQLVKYPLVISIKTPDKVYTMHENFVLFFAIVDLWRNKQSIYDIKVNLAKDLFWGEGREGGRLGYIVWAGNTQLDFFRHVWPRLDENDSKSPVQF